MVKIHPTSMKVTVQLTNISGCQSLYTQMVIILFLLWLDLKNEKINKKNKELDSFDYLVVFTLFHTLWHSHKTGNGIIAI